MLVASTVFLGDTADLITRMRGGMSAQEVHAIASDLGVGRDRLLELLRLPKRIGHVRTGAVVMSTTGLDRLYRAWRVLMVAVDVLDDLAAARQWLLTNNRALGGDVPLALLDTEVGFELVLDTLERIRHGIVS